MPVNRMDTHHHLYTTPTENMLVYICMQAAGVPTVPGSNGLVTSDEQAMEVAREVRTDHVYDRTGHITVSSLI